MRVFVSEYVTGGGWPEPTLPSSLAREGRAMWEAVIEDFARIPECRVVTTCDHRCRACAVKGVESIVVTSPDEEWDRFRSLAAQSDAVMVIAPELEDDLTRRVATVAEVAPSARLLNSSRETTHLCSDKLRLSGFLSGLAIDTPPTRLWRESSDPQPFEFPVVVKPRFGAGSQGVRLVRDRETDEAEVIKGFVAQPLIAGRAVSVAALRARVHAAWHVLPIAEQRLSSDGRFAYLGGRMPIRFGSVDAVSGTVDSVMQQLPDLVGYVGFDFVIPDASPDRPTLIEINPRLTTSYLGYRRLAKENLMARLLSATSPPMTWADEAVVYFPDGRVEGDALS